LIFSLYDEKGGARDGFLRAHEVFNLNLPADLVVLSACRTGLGKEVRGEGIVGLTRGFMYAGAARVLVSLWDVSDRATSELMGRFYEGMLKRKLRPAAALRAAQLAMARDPRFKAPYYWAGFVLQGGFD
jgi:CHAT domain-containing protein